MNNACPKLARRMASEKNNQSDRARAKSFAVERQVWSLSIYQTRRAAKPRQSTQSGMVALIRHGLYLLATTQTVRGTRLAMRIMSMYIVVWKPFFASVR